jgi:hypothetical protein
MFCPLCDLKVYTMNEYKDFHGNSFVVCCVKCGKGVGEMLDKLSAKYGGVEFKCGPMGSPKIWDIEQLKREVGA